MKKLASTKTLSNEIKQKIKKRIYIALLLASLLPIVLLIYSYIGSINSLKREIEIENKELGDYIIGQYLVDNIEAINFKIKAFN
ncbi:MAG: hypothetical protein ACK5Z5_09725, partial [Neisseriaceae bacterium]